MSSRVAPRLAPALDTAGAVKLFLGFALAYFFSALLRGITATLAPQFSNELGLSAGHLGLLAGVFFLGFAITQLPLGSALDRYGARRVSITFLLVAMVGCAAFAMAPGFLPLLAARGLMGVGLSACLMAPMATFRQRFSPGAQMRANSWILMTGSMGMVASTLPVQWLLPILGWRGLFWAIAAAIGVCAWTTARWIPRHVMAEAQSDGSTPTGGYLAIVRDSTFRRFAPVGFMSYGGLIAVQSLWAGPWLLEVSHSSAEDTARGLFAINVCMLLAFMTWGAVVPRLYARGGTAAGLVGAGLPLSIAALVLAIALGPAAGAWNWALFCVLSSAGAVAHPAVAQAFPAALAGRALSAYNLVIFIGVFALQWGMGAAIDGLRLLGWSTLAAYRGAFGLLALCITASYVWFVWRAERGPGPAPKGKRGNADNPRPCPD